MGRECSMMGVHDLVELNGVFEDGTRWTGGVSSVGNRVGKLQWLVG